MTYKPSNSSENIEDHPLHRPSTQYKDTLYYDGSCPLCSFEIRHLRRYCDDNLALVNIHDAEALDSEMPDRDQMLKVLHLKTADGHYLTGADANVAAWSHTRFGFLLKPLRWPVIRHLVDLIYGSWAARRFRKRYCSLASANR